VYKEIPLESIKENLSPYLSNHELQVHYQIYKDNLDKLNQLLDSNNYDYRYSLEELIQHIDIFPLNIRGEILYYLSSVLNHSLYFSNLSPNNYHLPVKTIEKDIHKYFGSYEEFKDQFKKKAMELKGSGYTFLVIDNQGKLKIINMSNEDSPYYYDMIPIMGLDLWEHAYFSQYSNDKEAYIEDFLLKIDFEKINAYYEKILMA
jgi:Fe-Mn family superoxide dismutase